MNGSAPTAVVEDAVVEDAVVEDAVVEDAVVEDVVTDDVVAEEVEAEAAPAAAPVIEDVATTEDGVAGDGAEDDRPAPGRRWLVIAAALLVLVMCAVAASAMLLVSAGRSTEATADRAAVVGVATDVVNAMVSVDGSAAQENLARIADETTDPLRGQLSGFSKVFASVLQQGQVRSVGSVADAGVESIGEGAATVLLSVNASVRNTQVPDGVQRSFRMVVTLRQIDGRWLAATVDVQS